MTTIEREHFLLHAPFQWVAVAGDKPSEHEFRNQTLPEQLIVTVLTTRKLLGQEETRQIAQRLAELRLEVLGEMSHGQGVHSPLDLRTGSGECEVRCVGRDEAQKVRLAFVVRAAPAKVVTVALTRYFLEEIGTPFEEYAATIFDFVQVKNPRGPK